MGLRMNAEKEAALLAQIIDAAANVAKELRTEIQDDGDFFLVHIVPKEMATSEDIEDALLRVRRTLLPVILPRVGLHSWMIVVSKAWGTGPADHAIFSEVLPGEIEENSK